MLYNEERPHTFNDVEGQEHIVENIRNQSIKNKWFHAYLFAGQFGGGKTSMAWIVALASNCTQKDESGNPCLKCESCRLILEKKTMDILEIDAASNTGVDAIRDLKESANYMPVNVSYKIYIIDEAHMLSKGAFNALLKLLEEPPKHTMFILCTTELNAIPATIRSRAAEYLFEQLTYAEIYNKLEKVSAAHGFDITADALSLIAKNAQGSMRNGLSLLEQVTSGEVEATAEEVQKMLGLSDPTYLFKLLEQIIKGDPAACIMLVEHAASKGKNMQLMVNDLMDIVADAVVAKSTSIVRIHDTEHYRLMLSNIIGISDIDQLCHIADALMDIRVQLRTCPAKTTVVVGIVRITSSVINLSILDRLEAVELMIKNGSFNINQADSKTFRTENQQEIKPVEITVKEIEPQTVINNEAVVETTVDDQINEHELESVEESLTMEQESIKDKEEMDRTSLSNNDEEVESNISTVIPDEDNARIQVTETLIREPAAEEGFDFFSMLDEFNGLAFSNSSDSHFVTSSQHKNDVTLRPDMERKKRSLEERLRLVSSGDEVFTTALQGCVTELQEEKLVLRTPLKSIFVIVKAYLRVCELSDIIVDFNPKVSLN